MRYLYFWMAAVLLAGGCGAPTVSLEDLETREITLPNSSVIRARVLTRPADMQRGMMFRDSLPRGRGMLFVHMEPGRHTYWMHNVSIPLDIIWMDSDRRIVEISHDTPPCNDKPPGECPSYGGNAQSRYVLELAGGEAKRLGLEVGDRLSF